VDYTKFDVMVDGVKRRASPKRRAILAVVKSLCGKGVSPKEITSLLKDIKNPERLFLMLPGTASPAQVRAAASDPSRWFCASDELIQFGGNTYAFSTQWGIKMTTGAIRTLLRSYPNSGISYQPVR
jgi:hypothetical protein